MNGTNNTKMINKPPAEKPNGAKFDGTRKCGQCGKTVHRTFKVGWYRWCQLCAKDGRIV
jgi:hypothetical protein